nr:hypothetical protein Iba_chr05aCG11930 [Ipomoea batatas]
MSLHSSLEGGVGRTSIARSKLSQLVFDGDGAGNQEMEATPHGIHPRANAVDRSPEARASKLIGRIKLKAFSNPSQSRLLRPFILEIRSKVDTHDQIKCSLPAPNEFAKLPCQIVAADSTSQCDAHGSVVEGNSMLRSLLLEFASSFSPTDQTSTQFPLVELRAAPNYKSEGAFDSLTAKCTTVGGHLDDLTSLPLDGNWEVGDSSTG